MARQRSFVAVLAAALLGGGAASCAPDQTSFFDLNASGDTSRDGARAPIYPLVAGPQNPGLGTLPPRSLDAVSLNAAVDCVSALRVTQRTVSRQGGVLGTQAVDAIKQAEAIFYERAQTQAGRQEEAGTDLSVAIERKTQLLLESPSDAAQHALACLRTLSGST